MKVLKALLLIAGGYIAGALLTMGGIELFSPNTHDKSLEAAMTAAFVGGPLGAFFGVIAAIAAAARTRKSSRPESSPLN